MRTEMNKKQGRPSEHSKEAQVKGAKRGKNSWGPGVWGEPPEKLAFLRFILSKMQFPCRKCRTFQTDRYLILGVCKAFL